MSLALPLCVDCPQASVLLSDRTGLKQRVIRRLWLTQARGREEYRMRGEPAVAEADMALQQPEARSVFSPGKLSLDHRTLAGAGCTGSWEGRCG